MWCSIVRHAAAEKPACGKWQARGVRSDHLDVGPGKPGREPGGEVRVEFHRGQPGGISPKHVRGEPGPRAHFQQVIAQVVTVKDPWQEFVCY
jgi:hypothetical protein